MKNPIGRRRTLVIATSAALLAAGLAAGCGSSGSGDDGSASEGTTTTAAESNVAFKGEPVTIFLSGPLKNQLGDLSQAVSAVQIAVKKLNAEGGLAGHEVKVVSCNDIDPNSEIACARKAVEQKAIAFVGSTFVTNPDAAEKLLDEAKIPNVAPLVATNVEYEHASSFPIDGATFGAITCAGQTAAETGKKKIGYVANNLALQKQLGGAIEQITEAMNLTFTGATYVPLTTTDYSSAASKLASAGTEIAISLLPPTATPAYLQSVAATGGDAIQCMPSPVIGLDALKKLGPAAENVYVTASIPPSSTADQYPLVKQYVADMKEAEEGGDENAQITGGTPENALRAYLGVYVLEQAARKVKGELTGASMTAALNASTIDFGGALPTIDFSKPLYPKPFSRAWNGTVRLLKWNTEKQILEPAKGPEADALALLTGKQ